MAHRWFIIKLRVEIQMPQDYILSVFSIIPCERLRKMTYKFVNIEKLEQNNSYAVTLQKPFGCRKNLHTIDLFFFEWLQSEPIGKYIGSSLFSTVLLTYPQLVTELDSFDTTIKNVDSDVNQFYLEKLKNEWEEPSEDFLPIRLLIKDLPIKEVHPTFDF